MPSTSTDRIRGLSTSVAIKAPVKAVATENITLSGAQTINGVAVTDGDRVLVTAQTDATTNGIYDVVSTGAWRRSADFDGSRDIVPGTLVVGPPNGGTGNWLDDATAETVGEALWPATDAELTAGLTDDDLLNQYPVGDVRRYGAVGDGSTDDLTAIQAAFDSAITGEEVSFPATSDGYYAVSDTVSVPAGISVNMEQPVLYTGSSNVAIIEIGDPLELSQFCTYRLGAERDTRTWGNDGAVGIKLINLQHCRGEIFEASENTIGVLATGDATGVAPAAARGFAYNDISFGEIRNNKYALVLESKGGSGANVGYINENTWRNGNFVNDSNVLTTTSRYGVVIRSADAAYANNNNNVFLKPCFQVGEPTGGAEGVAFTVEDGLLNTVVRGRFEANTMAARFSGASARNYVDAAYLDESEFTYEEIETASENWVTRPNRESANTFSKIIYSLTDIARLARGTSGTRVMVPGASWTQSGAATRLAYSGTSVTYDANHVTIPGTRGIGFYVDTSTVKEFVVFRRGSAGGRVGITPYDSGNTIITTAGTVSGTVSATLSYTASYGGAWITGNDNLNPVYFKVSSSTAYVWVFVAGGTGSAVISDISICTTPYVGEVRAYAGFQTNFLYGSATWDPGSIAVGASATTTITVTGAEVGDIVECSFSLSLSGLSLTGYVSSGDTITVVLLNNTAAPVDLNSGTVRVQVTKPYAPA
jgi:hypothetical protein